MGVKLHAKCYSHHFSRRYLIICMHACLLFWPPDLLCKLEMLGWMIIGAFKGHDSECEEEAVLVRRFAFGRENEIN